MISSGTLHTTAKPLITRTADEQLQIVLACEDRDGNLPTTWKLILVGASALAAINTVRHLAPGSAIDVITYSPYPLHGDGRMSIVAQCLDIQVKRTAGRAEQVEVAA